MQCVEISRGQLAEIFEYLDRSQATATESRMELAFYFGLSSKEAALIREAWANTTSIGCVDERVTYAFEILLPC